MALTLLLTLTNVKQIEGLAGDSLTTAGAPG